MRKTLLKNTAVNVKGRGHVGQPGLDGRIILNAVA
jgi:hypothetical protein